jgi:hypothetical protein
LRSASKLAIACFCAISLSGCMTDKKTADTGPAAGDTAVAAAGPQPMQGPRAGLTAKGSLTANTHYVDPLVSTAGRHQQQARQQPGTQAPAAAGQQLQTPPPAASTAAAFPPPPAAPAQSLSGLATQPTGVRAGSFSIFSSAAPAPSAMPPAPPAPAAAASQAPDATGSVPTGGNFSATSGSVFTPRQPLAPRTCPTDKSGRPVNC